MKEEVGSQFPRNRRHGCHSGSHGEAPGGSGGRRGEGETWKESLLWLSLEGMDRAA